MVTSGTGLAPTSEKPKIRACYLSIPNQLARENKKFKYATVVEHGRSRMFYASIDWLRESALVFQCPNVETPDTPLSVYKKEDCFKLYASDIGILVSMVGFPAVKAILATVLTTSTRSRTCPKSTFSSKATTASFQLR